ncbi:MAG: phage major capsid protein [Anaeromyxobacter sp.]
MGRVADAYVHRIVAEAGRRHALATVRDARRRPRAALRPGPVAQAAAPAPPPTRSTTTDRPGDPRAMKESTMQNIWKGSLAGYALAVRNAITKKAPVDPRLGIFAANQPTTIGTEGTGADGGYLVPPDVRSAVVQAVLAEWSLLGQTDRHPTKSNSVTMPADAAPAWLSSGPQPALDPEAAAFKQAKGALESRTVRLTKLDVLVPVTDELVEDGAAALDAYLKQAVIDRLTFRINDHLLNNSGAGGPQGILSSPALVTQTKESGQTAGTVVYANVQKMWSRLYSPSKARAVWIAHSDVEMALQGVTAPTGAPALVYVPGEPFPRLFGRPVLVTEAAQPIGTVGDLVLVDPGSIFTAMREGDNDGLKADFSMHVWFDQGISAFRFTMRVGAASWWAQPVSRYRGGATLSTHVALEAR